MKHSNNHTNIDGEHEYQLHMTQIIPTSTYLDAELEYQLHVAENIPTPTQLLVLDISTSFKWQETCQRLHKY